MFGFTVSLQSGGGRAAVSIDFPSLTELSPLGQQVLTDAKDQWPDLPRPLVGAHEVQRATVSADRQC